MPRLITGLHHTLISCTQLNLIFYLQPWWIQWSLRQWISRNAALRYYLNSPLQFLANHFFSMPIEYPHPTLFFLWTSSWASYCAVPPSSFSPAVAPVLLFSTFFILFPRPQYMLFQLRRFFYGFPSDPIRSTLFRVCCSDVCGDKGPWFTIQTFAKTCKPFSFAMHIDLHICSFVGSHINRVLYFPDCWGNFLCSIAVCRFSLSGDLPVVFPQDWSL